METSFDYAVTLGIVFNYEQLWLPVIINVTAASISEAEEKAKIIAIQTYTGEIEHSWIIDVKIKHQNY